MFFCVVYLIVPVSFQLTHSLENETEVVRATVGLCTRFSTTRPLVMHFAALMMEHFHIFALKFFTKVALLPPVTVNYQLLL